MFLSVLWKYRCPICGATGAVSHTIKYWYVINAAKVEHTAQIMSAVIN